MLTVSLCVSTDIVHYVLKVCTLRIGLFSSFQPGGADYGNVSVVVVTFEEGSTFSSYASIPIALDNIQESDETFKATFELPDGYRNLKKTDPMDVEITIEGENQGLYEIGR